MGLQVIGAGYGRTGTRSLKEALEILLNGPCYHMETLLQNPHQIKHWNAALNNEEAHWKTLFQDYTAIVDFPGSVYFKTLYDAFPGAKVILSIRDPEQWYKSVSETIFRPKPGIILLLKVVSRLPFSKTARDLVRVGVHNNTLLWKRHFEGRFRDKAYAIGNYQRHIAAVKKNIPPEDLLIYEAGQGWEPICRFLNCKVPDQPYPYLNKGGDFHQLSRDLLNGVLR